jgi:hypothetical protein
MNFYKIIDFPTPVEPVKKTGLLMLTSISSKVEYLYVSIVGTKREKKGVLTSYSNAGTFLAHGTNFNSFSMN